MKGAPETLKATLAVLSEHERDIESLQVALTGLVLSDPRWVTALNEAHLRCRALHDGCPEDGVVSRLLGAGLSPAEAYGEYLGVLWAVLEHHVFADPAPIRWYSVVDFVPDLTRRAPMLLGNWSFSRLRIFMEAFWIGIEATGGDPDLDRQLVARARPWVQQEWGPQDEANGSVLRSFLDSLKGEAEGAVHRSTTRLHEPDGTTMHDPALKLRGKPDGSVA